MKKFSLINLINFLQRISLRRQSKNSCQCKGCVIGDKYSWAVISECPCACHKGDGVTGHDGLCCAYPNALKDHNPYKILERSLVYKKEREDYYGKDY